jgi:hypothetical protein
MPRGDEHEMRTRSLAAILGLALAGALAAAQPADAVRRRAPHGLIGDANGDGVFDGRDVSYLEQVLALGATDNFDFSPRSDVAPPCEGFADAADLSLLRTALWDGARSARTPSPCFGGLQVGTLVALPRKPAVTPPPTLDQRFVQVADLVPEFAGMYTDANDVVHILLTDPTPPLPDDAFAALASVFGLENLPSDQYVAELARFDWHELFDAKTVARAVLDLPGVVSLDIVEDRNLLRVGVDDVQVQATAAAELASLGLDLAMFDFGVESVPIPGALVDDLQAVQRPLFGGVEIGSSSGACSLGVVAKSAGRLGFLTNTHCNPTPGTPGAPYTQNAAGFAVATSVAEAAFITNGATGCPPAETCLRADVGFAQLNGTTTALRGTVAKDPSTPPTQQPFAIVVQEVPTFQGKAVRRVGRTSGQQSGSVVHTCTDIQSDWAGSGINGPPLPRLLCQFQSNASASPGDSGGPVISNHVPTIVTHYASFHGLNWGGASNWFSDIAGIEAVLGPVETEYANEPPTLQITSPASGSTISSAFPQVTFEASFFDLERGNGTSCSTCTVSWTSDLDGFLGSSTPVTGVASLAATLSGPGTRQITASTVDGSETVQDSIVLVTSNDPPVVSIDWPTPQSTIYVGVPVVFRGSSFDAQSFGPLPCAALGWTSDLVPLGSGCTKLHTYTTGGSKAVGLAAFDSEGAPGTDLVNVTVSPLPATGLFVTLEEPVGTLLPPDQPATLRGTAVDPDAAGPIAYQWVLVQPSGQSVLGTDSGASGADVTLQWTPAGDVPPKCGGRTVTVELRATDAGSQTGSSAEPVQIAFPPC